MLIVICGPIASGKSTTARAVARLLEQRGHKAAAIDLDLVYEMLEHRDDGEKADSALWTSARRAAAALTDGLLRDGTAVVVEGDLLLPEHRKEFRSALRSSNAPLFVTVHVPVETALKRVLLDPTRGLSRDSAFLRIHYRELEGQLRRRPATDLVMDTSSETVDGVARAIVDWASVSAST